MGAGGSGEPVELLVMPVLWLLSWFVHLVFFLGGWTLYVWEVGDDGKVVRKVRYRRKKHARADAGRVLNEALAGA
ncbi:hypothetical protein GCM10009534_49710 [Kribbella sandramycini]